MEPGQKDYVGSANLLKVRATRPLHEEKVRYTGMDVSFNPTEHIPNWVSWELTVDETYGEEKRKAAFETDETVTGCPTTNDYRNSGFDRGHMAPAGDMKWSEQAMHETFYLTNICPQAKQLNTGAWKKLEEKCRQWAQADSAIYIVCGPVMTDPVEMHIGATGVRVPQRFFKVVLSPYTTPARGIGFIMPNEKVEGGMQRCATSIREVERITGLDFFYELDDSIENAVETQNDFNAWNRVK